jgi:predicted  nucleic acid-binding Zn-ribbon protein
MTIAVRPETYEQYKILKAQGYTWNAIINQGIQAINEQNNTISKDQLADRFQKQLTALGSENELLRQRIKRQELRDKLENGEINQEQYEQLKTMYDDSIRTIERRSGEDRRAQDL